MKISRMKMIAAACAAMLLLGGCGETPYELTESEEALIVNYAANVVSKYNIKQKDGLTYVHSSLLETETEEVITEIDTEEVIIPDDTQMLENTEQDLDTSGGTAEETVAPGKSLQELFGVEGITVAYAGYEVNPNYVEEDYYSLNASAGKTYLIMKIEMTNQGAQEAVIDNLAKQPTFRATVDGTEVAGETTILLTDFSTYQGTIAPGETINTVLIFTISEETAANIADISLNVNLNGEKIAVIL